MKGDWATPPSYSVTSGVLVDGCNILEIDMRRAPAEHLGAAEVSGGPLKGQQVRHMLGAFAQLVGLTGFEPATP